MNACAHRNVWASAGAFDWDQIKRSWIDGSLLIQWPPYQAFGTAHAYLILPIQWTESCHGTDFTNASPNTAVSEPIIPPLKLPVLPSKVLVPQHWTIDYWHWIPYRIAKCYIVGALSALWWLVQTVYRRETWWPQASRAILVICLSGGPNSQVISVEDKCNASILCCAFNVMDIGIAFNRA